MKKILALTLALILAFTMFAACGGTNEGASEEPGDTPASGSAEFDPAAIKTIGDAFAAADPETLNTAYTETEFVVAFPYEEAFYRAHATLPKDISDQIWAIDIEDETRDDQIKELVKDLELDSFTDLNAEIPSQEELDKFVGMTGGELFEDNWSYSSYNLADMEADLDHGPYTYTVKFDYDGEPMENTDDFDFYEAFKDLTVASVTYSGIGNPNYTDDEL